MQKMKKSFLRLDALLLVAVLLLQGCKLDTAPDAFSFATQTNVAPDTPIESEPVTISGINFPAQLSITGGEYSIDGSAYGGSPGHVKNNQTVRIRVQSSDESSGNVSATRDDRRCLGHLHGEDLAACRRECVDAGQIAGDDVVVAHVHAWGGWEIDE